jgi:hypothetical protein
MGGNNTSRRRDSFNRGISASLTKISPEIIESLFNAHIAGDRTLPRAHAPALGATSLICRGQDKNGWWPNPAMAFQDLNPE